MPKRGRGPILLLLWAVVALRVLAAEPKVRSEALAYLASRGSVWVDGQRVPDEIVVFSGDVVTTASASTAVLTFKSRAAAKLAENTEAVLSRDAAPGTLTLRRGRLEVRTDGEHAARVKLPGDEVIVQGQDGSPALCTITSLRAVLTIVPHLGQAEIQGAGPPLRVVPGQYAQLGAGRPQPSGARAGAVTRAIPEEVVRHPSGSEAPLGEGDPVNWEDLVGTLKTGKVEIRLDDTSVLALGSQSRLRLRRQDPQTQQTQVDLPQGYLRADVAEIFQTGAIFLVKTQTAAIRARGTSFLVQAQQNRTRVYCTGGQVAVRNVDPVVAGEVTVHGGEYTTVVREQPPTVVLQFSVRALVKAMSATNVNPPRQGWYIGSLSHGESVATVVAVTAGAGATAAVLIPALTGGTTVSPSQP
jgi:ferric-dicitrate binding protein FerR (iron transport regulator)